MCVCMYVNIFLFFIKCVRINQFCDEINFAKIPIHKKKIKKEKKAEIRNRKLTFFFLCHLLSSEKSQQSYAANDVGINVSCLSKINVA